VIEAIKNVTDDTDVLIVGAGAAGLAAARQLSVSNFNVVVLEARDRIGGRINTPTLYVEGFHAAHADRISVKGLNKTNRAAAEIDDEKQFRASTGYLPLMEKLYDEAVEQGVSFRFGQVVQEVTWNSGSVTVTSTQGERIKARRLRAYSYIPVGGTDAQKELAEPVENTIYFAGEAINTAGHHGTVHGALASGLHAARLIQQL